VKLTLASVRGSRAPWADEQVATYGQRIQRWFPFEDLIWKAADPDLEADRLLGLLGPRVRLMALDERGIAVTSEGFAALLSSAADEGATQLVVAVGGAHGHAPRVRERAWKVVRLSDMVLPHALARVLAAEQLYRACTIRAGEPYHHRG